MGKIPTLKRKDVINTSGLSARTIDRLVASGELPAYRIGKRGLRFHEDDVAALFRPVRSARAAAEGLQDLDAEAHPRPASKPTIPAQRNHN